MLERPTPAEVWWMGSVERLSPKRFAGPQETNDLSTFQPLSSTVFRTSPFPGLAGSPRTRCKQSGASWRVVGLTDKVQTYPGQLSGGQKQRLASLGQPPTEALLCDEATSALDLRPQDRCSVCRTINEWSYHHLITHEMAVIQQICDRSGPRGRRAA